MKLFESVITPILGQASSRGVTLTDLAELGADQPGKTKMVQP